MSDAPLDHPRRQAIFEAVKRNPGLNWNQLQRQTGLAVGALLFHLDRLEEQGALVRKPSTNRNEVLFFTEDQVDLWRNPRTRLLFGNEATRRVAEVIARRPGASATDIADEIGVHPVTVRYHLNKLTESQLVDGARDGRQIHYRPSGELTTWLDRFGDRP